MYIFMNVDIRLKVAIFFSLFPRIHNHVSEAAYYYHARLSTKTSTGITNGP